jgi:hypothetical protein
MADAPDQLDLGRHRDLQGRGSHVWVRRGILTLLGAIVLAALLGTFGQHPATSHAQGADARLEVQSPARLRGGLIFQARFTIAAVRRIAKPTLVLGSGWFESMSINSTEPNPVEEKVVGRDVRMTFEALPAGTSTTVWIYFQVNPTNVGSRSQDVRLEDGERTLAAVHRSVTIFP